MGGTYFLTAETFYPGASPTPATDQQTIVVDATAGTVAFADLQDGKQAYLAATYTTSSPNINVTFTCGTSSDGGILDVPGGDTKTWTYTATSTTFTISAGSSSGDTQSVYTLQ